MSYIEIDKLSKSFKKAKEEGNLEEVIQRSKEVAAEIKELSAKNEEYLNRFLKETNVNQDHL